MYCVESFRVMEGGIVAECLCLTLKWALLKAFLKSFGGWGDLSFPYPSPSLSFPPHISLTIPLLERERGGDGGEKSERRGRGRLRGEGERRMRGEG